MTMQKAKLFLITLFHTIDGFQISLMSLSTEPTAAPELRADNHWYGAWLCGRRPGVVTDVGSEVTG